jgi:hypothetical protein
MPVIEQIALILLGVNLGLLSADLITPRKGK